MSLQTWEEEFYTSMLDAKEWTDKQCFEHTLTKYQGLKKENLAKHDVTLSRAHVGSGYVNSEKFFVGTSNCALCQKYYDREQEDDDDPRTPCKKCPLDKAAYGCFNDSDGTHKSFNLWDIMYVKNDPKPMIKQMKEMIAECNNKGESK